MSIKLRELIRNVRACKTAAEERSVIAKEGALCRTAFKSKDNQFRHRNVAKLLYIHMLGYPTHFGQMESVKLIASQRFPEKRIGYLGLMVLLDERQKVLMLVTNQLKIDFQSVNQYVVGLALCALGNISSTDIARDLAGEVEKKLRDSNPYVRKKAALCAIRIIRKVPDLIEDFLPAVGDLLNDKNHAVILTGVSLIIEMIRIDPQVIEGFRKLVSNVVRVLKNLVLAGYVSDYDVVGITDPFLQIKLIQLLRLLGTGNASASDAMNDILAQVAINTEPTKNPGNAILYETVMCIMSIEAEGGLRVLAINILGRFLLNRDNNIRYVALNTLCKVVNRDTQAIQRHRNTVVDCLKDPDISIRKRALDLIYALVTKQNVKALVKELLNYLALTSGDEEFKSDLTDKICRVVERFAPNRRWHIDTMINVLSTAGNFTANNVSTDLILLISQSKELYPYSVHKLYTAIRKTLKQNTQLPLLHVGLWCVGEYGDILVSKVGLEKANVDTKPPFLPVSENKVLDTIEKVMKSVVASLTTREYALNALAKLTTRFSEEAQERLAKLIGTYKTSIHLELQQRSCEYSALSGGKHKAIRSNVVGRMPIPKNIKKKPAGDEKFPSETSGSTPVTSVGSPKASPKKVERKLDPEKAKGKTNGVKETDEEEDEDETPEEPVEKPKPSSSKKQPKPAPAPAEKEKEPPKQTAEPGIFDLDIFGPGSPQPQSPPKSSGSGAGSASTTDNPLGLLDDIFSGTGFSQSQFVIPQQKQQSPPIQQTDFSLLDFPTSTPSPSPFIPQPTFSPPPVSSFTPPPVSTPGADALLPVVVFQESSLTVSFQSERKTGNPGYLRVTATFTNSASVEFTDFDFQVAVPQFVTLQMEPASGRVLTPHTPITQALVLIHKEPDNAKKKLKIRVKMAYNVQGTPAEHTAQIQKFWA